ncbi:MAG: GNAT family N-acetyltransferase [Candidatus Latescibacteria bacterium]|nr:GNAT family N-acetyltransferase [Candidatus Latescibacterota bacterium]
MIELSPGDFPRVIPLLKHPLLCAEAKSIANGHTPGWIFADAYDRPKVALIWSKGIEGFFLAGDPTQTDIGPWLDRFVGDVIAPRAQELGWGWFEVSGCAPGWDRSIEQAFSERLLEQETILVYKFKKPLDPPTRRLPTGAALHRLDAAFFRNPPCQDISFINDKIQLFWADLDSFLNFGVGFCATLDAALASVCLTGFVADGVHVIDIETLEPYQRRGLGFQVGHAFISHCLESGLEAQWGCMEENKPSSTLAESLGLGRVAEYAVFYFPLVSK